MFTIPLSIHIFVMALWSGARLKSQINLEKSWSFRKELYVYVTSLAIQVFSPIVMLFCKLVGVLMHDIDHDFVPLKLKNIG